MSFYTGKEVHHEYLDYEPVEILRLSEEGVNALKRTGITSIGDCIYGYKIWTSGSMISLRGSIIKVILGELRIKLMQHNYWYLTGIEQGRFDY